MMPSEVTLRSFGKLVPVFLATSALLPVTAFAQDAPLDEAETENQDEAVSGLGTIVVTAQRREESLQDTPISVAAFSAESLAQTGTRDISDIAQLTPNVSIDNAVTLSGSSVASSLFIRGVGQSDFLLTTDPGVGLYLDGVYIARSVGSLLDVVDVERIEVLRGPQGTLYGKNTIGGAINVVTQRPSFSGIEGQIRGTLGSADRHDLIASVNIPLADTAALRVSGATLNQDGFVTLVDSGVKLGNRNRWTVRGALAFDIGDNLSVDIAGDYLKARESGGATTLVEIEPQGVQVIANQMLGLTYDDRFIPSDPYLAFGQATGSDAEVWGISATLTYDLGNVTFKSITGYRGFNSFFERDGDQSPLTLLFTDSLQSQTQFTQEVQVLGDAFDGAVDFIAGGYYGNEQGDDFANLVTRQLAVVLDQQDIDTESLAAFGQVTVRPLDGLSITGGIRYTKDTKTVDSNIFIGEVTPGTGGPPPFVVGLPIVPRGLVKRSFDKVTYRLAIQYEWTDDLMTYATFSTGFKSGGFVQRNAVFSPAVPSFGPETVEVFEAGIKWTGFKNRLRLNAAAFTNSYDDLQITVLVPFAAGLAPQTQNAGTAEINGFEIDAELLLGDALHLSGGIGYLDADYTSLAPSVVGVTLDSELVRAPEWCPSSELLAQTELGSFGGSASSVVGSLGGKLAVKQAPMF
ncbi:hypothetical protein GCM10023208_34070 [Erythrobacter westpacificensis]|uniref:TonB-dependent receptor n=1 Tax=Erythrobacter westpacificensis TaxID=1055231 RepID=A0ABP9KSX0_9SPHN